MFDRNEKQGCGLTPGTMVVLGLLFVWMMVVVPAYQRWRKRSNTRGSGSGGGLT